MERKKENALPLFWDMTLHSWTYGRMTEKERQRLQETFINANENGQIFGSYRQRWTICKGIYNAFLAGLGYDGFMWRENGVDVPRVIVEVDGGNVTNIYSDKPISVDVMDFDNLNAGDEYAVEVYKEFHDIKGLQRVY